MCRPLPTIGLWAYTEVGEVYWAEIWVEGGTLKVRGYLGMLYRTQTWRKAS
jgi:uncharacterized protein (DUF2147 family)